MPRITKYRNLSNDELLHHVDAARQVSDIIEELAARLEAAEPVLNTVLECPHCEAAVTLVEGDEGVELQ